MRESFCDGKGNLLYAHVLQGYSNTNNLFYGSRVILSGIVYRTVSYVRDISPEKLFIFFFWCVKYTFFCLLSSFALRG